MEQKTMGEIICQYRKERGLTQKQLAERIGVTNKAISKWETGDGYPDIMTIPSLAEALEISADELFGIETKLRLQEQESTVSGINVNKREIKDFINRDDVWKAVFIYSLMMAIARLIEVILNEVGRFYFGGQLVGISILVATCIVAYKQVRVRNFK